MSQLEKGQREVWWEVWIRNWQPKIVVVSWRRQVSRRCNTQYSWCATASLVAPRYQVHLLKGAQGGGRTWDLFDFRLFSLTRSALDHSATAPPCWISSSKKWSVVASSWLPGSNNWKPVCIEMRGSKDQPKDSGLQWEDGRKKKRIQFYKSRCYFQLQGSQFVYHHLQLLILRELLLIPCF